MTIRKEPLTPELAQVLIQFSQQWEQENSTYGYRANTVADFQDETIYVAYQNDAPVGYLFGHVYIQELESCTIPKNSRCFEVDELYILPQFRSQGIGSALFQFAEQDLPHEISFLTLTTATKRHRAILHFYIEELGMNFWSARLFKPHS